MKRYIAALLTLLLFLCPLSACGTRSSQTDVIKDIKTYTDIPGITIDEISAIEEIKAANAVLTYGMLLSTESFIMPDGNYGGFTVKFCDYLSELFGMDFQLKLYEWDELIDNLESLELDFTGELTSSEERLLKYSMTRPIAERLLRLFAHKDNEDISSESDINGLTIGFLEDTITAETIKRSYKLSFTTVFVPDYSVAAEMIASGEIDAFVDEAVADPAFEQYDFISSEIMFHLIHSPVSMTTANPELAAITSVIDRFIIAGGGNKLYEMYSEGNFEYAKHKLVDSYDPREKAYIEDLTRRGASILILCDNDSYPCCFYNQTEQEFQGIAIDVLNEISMLTDIRFEIAEPSGSVWSGLLEMVRTGEMPMAAELLRTDSREGDYIWTAVPYSSCYYAIISRIDYPYLVAYQVAQTSVGVLRKSGYEDMYKELFPDNDNIVYYDTLNECLDALETGEVDLLMGSEHVMLTQMNYRERSGLKVNIILDTPMESYYGFSKNEAVLCSVIDKAQQYIQMEKIEMSWVSRMFDYSKKIAEQRVRYLTVFSVVLVLILISAVFLLIRNLRLDKELKQVANNDALTGIFNRRFFMELSAIQMERSRRSGTESFIVIFDLDHFKLVNDTYGHLAGDKVLKDIAQRIKASVRPYDVLGRYGGEEFIILITAENSKEGAADTIRTVERLRLEVCSSPVEFENIMIPVSASFGIARAAPLNDIQTAIKYADEALYKAKETGRNKAVFYGDEQ